ncbi:MAG: SAM-dependent methyltransferase, partial [Solirubrobacteraceae bacterium]
MSAPLRTPPEVFERLYADSADPWRYSSSPYEAAKYARTLAALEQRRYARALEVGCSIGVFTDALAARCEAVIALDPSPTALSRARLRLSGHDNVELRLGAVPDQFPDGVFD